MAQDWLDNPVKRTITSPIVGTDNSADIHVHYCPNNGEIRFKVDFAKKDPNVGLAVQAYLSDTGERMNSRPASTRVDFMADETVSRVGKTDAGYAVFKKSRAEIAKAKSIYFNAHVIMK